MAENEPYRVVLDTNVMISGILWTGPPHQILKLAEAGRLQIFASPEIIKEVFDVIKRDKFARRIYELKTSVSEIMVGLLHLVQIVESKKHKLTTDEKPVDRDDEMFIFCALTSQASFLVTGDPHLKVLKEIRGIKILSPDEFLGMIDVDEKGK